MTPSFRTAQSIEDAVDTLVERPDWHAVCGGTDVLVKMNFGRLQPAGFVNLWGVMPRHIAFRGQELRLGAGVTCADIQRSDLVRDRLAPLWQAARTMGSQQIRNRATLGGNIGNASPAADLVPALMVEGARVITQGPNGGRDLALGSVFVGPGATLLERGESVTEILVPLPQEKSYCRFDKLGFRQSQVIAVVNFAIRATSRHSAVDTLRIVWGAVAPKPVRSHAVEGMLRGCTLSDALVREALEALDFDICPIDDHRASRAYRMLVARGYLGRALKELQSWISS